MLNKKTVIEVLISLNVFVSLHYLQSDDHLWNKIHSACEEQFHNHYYYLQYEYYTFLLALILSMKPTRVFERGNVVQEKRDFEMYNNWSKIVWRKSGLIFLMHPIIYIQVSNMLPAYYHLH